MQPDASKIRLLLKKTQHHDKDERFMATSDLTEELEKIDGHLDSALQTPIREAILRQLDDASNDVQAIATKCLSAIVQKFNVEQVEEIVNKLGNLLVEGKMEVRDIYTIGLKTIISSVPDDFGPQIARKLVPHLLSGLTQRKSRGDTDDEKMEIERNFLDRNIACLDILKDLLSTFGYVMQEHHKKILDTVVPMLNDEKSDIRKKVTITLGSIVSVLEDAEFRQLIKNVIDTIQALDQNNEILFDYIQTISIFSRNAGKRISEFLDQIVDHLMRFANVDNDSNSEQIQELQENSLQAFETLILQCPAEISQYTTPLLNLGLKLMTFDPNYSYDQAMPDANADGMEVDDDDDDDDGWGSDDGAWSDDGQEVIGGDDDDTSWKVRRAALKMLTAYIQTHKASVQEYHLKLCDSLLDRFKERDVNVKMEVFKSFRELLLASIVAEEGGVRKSDSSLTPFGELPGLVRQVSAFQLMSEKLPQIMDYLVKEFSDTSGGAKVRLGILDILSDLVLVRQASRSERCDPLSGGGLSEYFNDLIPHIITCMSDQDVQLQTKSLYVLYLLLNRHQPSDTISILEMIKDAVVASVEVQYSRVKSQALLTVARMIEIIRPFSDGDLSYDASFNDMSIELFETSFRQLALKDIEQEVKKAALDSVAKCVAHFGDLLSNRLQATLDVLLDRLNNEVTRQTALHAFTTIAHSPLNVDMSNCVNQLVQTSCALLKQHSSSLRHDTAIALRALIANSGRQISRALLGELVANSGDFINDSDLHLCSLILDMLAEVVRVQPEAVVIIQKDIFPHAFEFLQSPLLQGRALESLKELFRVFQQHSNGNTMGFAALKEELIKSARADLSRQSYGAISQCLTALTLQTDDTTSRNAVNEFIGLIASQEDNRAQVALLCIGEIGRVNDLSVHGNLEEKVFAAFASQSESVKWAASFAFGNMAVGNMSRYVPSLLSLIQLHVERQYLLLNSLKEIIAVQSCDSESRESLRPYADSVVPLLLNSANSPDEGVRAMVAECLGRFAVVEVDIFNDVERLLSEKASATRATMAASLKFGLSEGNHYSLPVSTIGQFLNTLNDEDVTVKRQAFLTLNAILHVNSMLVSSQLTQILPIVYESSITNVDLIREVDLGPFKHRVDDGLPLRKAAFQCLETLLDSCSVHLDMLEFLNFLKNGIIDESPDIQMLTYQILTRLAHFHGPRILHGLDGLQESLMKGIKSRMTEAKSGKDSERAKDILRAAVKALFAMKNIPNSAVARKFTTFYSRVQKTKILLPMLEELKNEADKSHRGA